MKLKIKIISSLLILTFFALQGDQPIPKTLPVYHHSSYSVCYDARTKNPAWVYEILTEESLRGEADRTMFAFKEDKVIPEQFRATLEDYHHTGFDKGHLSPACDNRGSEEKMFDTFFLSNVCPQAPKFNRGYWSKLERHVRDLTKSFSAVHVITGPLYLPQEGEDGKRWVKYQVIGEGDVAVPTHFFKVIILEDSAGERESLAYVLPNEPISATTPLEKFRSTVKNVEKIAGIMF